MTREEIRQKAIECGKSFGMMCRSKESEVDDKLNAICHCEYNVANVASCATVYGYEHGFADGVEEGKKQSINHGHWVGVGYNGYADGNPVYDIYECSVCGEEHYGEEDTLTPFCPYCGAMMDEEGEQK